MTNYRVVRQFLLMIIIVALYPDVKSQELSQKDYRLPTHIIPIRYEINLKIETFTKDWNASNAFDGEVKITFGVIKGKTNHSIILNSNSLKIKTVQLDDKEIAYTPVEKLQRLEINGTLENDGKNHTLTLTYGARMNTGLTGLHYGFYTDPESHHHETFSLIKTQMAPVYARSVFPCFDEPALKAVFKLNISYPKMFKVALSNTDIENSTSTGNLITTTFKETPKMSPHLLAFALFENLTIDDSHTVSRINFTIGFRPHLKNAYEYARDISDDIVKEYEKVTGIPYIDATSEMITKVEQVGIPHSLLSVMDSWGLTLYREDVLFWDHDQSSAEAKEIIATEISHKLGQVWFEHLKTPKWWSMWWISKGFVTFYKYQTLAKIEPTWGMKNQLVVEGLLNMHTSSRRLALPEASILDSQRIVLTLLQDLAASKEAAIIRMMSMIMGENIFNRGVKNFMSKKRPNVVTPQYVWDSWKEEEDLNNTLPKSLSEIMQSWTENAGFPIVSVTRKNNQVELTAVGIDGSLNTVDSVWYIPITYTTHKEPSNFFNTAPEKRNWIMKTEKLVLDEDLRSRGSWIAVNIQSAAYMRVNYDRTLWLRLETALKANPTQFHVLNRVQIVDDVINLALLEKLPFSLAFRVLGYLRLEIDYFPWYTAVRGFQRLRQTLEANEIYTLHTYVGFLFANFYKSVSDDIADTASMKRTFAHVAACEMENSNCLKQMRQKFKEFVKGGVAVDPNIRFNVYCTGLKSKDGLQFWDTLYKRMIETKVPFEEDIIASALTCADNVAILKRYLGFFLKKNSRLNPHNLHDVSEILEGTVTHTRSGRQALIEFLDENAADVARYEIIMMVSISLLGETINSKDQLNAMQRLAEKPEMASYASLFDSSITQIEKALVRNKNLRKLIMGSLRKTPRFMKSTGVIAAVIKKTLLLLLLATTFLGIY